MKDVDTGKDSNFDDDSDYFQDVHCRFIPTNTTALLCETIDLAKSVATAVLCTILHSYILYRHMFQYATYYILSAICIFISLTPAMCLYSGPMH